MSFDSAFAREAVITAYFKYAECGSDNHESFWGWDAIGQYIATESAEPGWDLVVELVRRSPDALLGKVAAGPLEDWVARHGPTLVEWIEGEARRNPRFRHALGRIWLTRGQLPPDIAARIVVASGGMITLLDEGPTEGDSGQVRVTISAEALSWLLDELCVNLGFCLSLDARQRLRDKPPADALAMARAVWNAEGMDASQIGSRQFHAVLAATERAYISAP